MERRTPDLARLLGISYSAAYRRMTGIVPFDITELSKIADFLGVRVSDLLGPQAVAEAS